MLAYLLLLEVSVHTADLVCRIWDSLCLSRENLGTYRPQTILVFFKVPVTGNTVLGNLEAV